MEIINTVSSIHLDLDVLWQLTHTSSSQTSHHLPAQIQLFSVVPSDYCLVKLRHPLTSSQIDHVTTDKAADGTYLELVKLKNGQTAQMNLEGRDLMGMPLYHQVA